MLVLFAQQLPEVEHRKPGIASCAAMAAGGLRQELMPDLVDQSLRTRLLRDTSSFWIPALSREINGLMVDGAVSDAWLFGLAPDIRIDISA